MRYSCTFFVFSFLLGILFAGSGVSQTVPSSCDAPDSIKAKYTEDAQRLTLQYIYEQNLPEKNDPQIPKAYTDTMLNALLAVYNADALPESDTVIRIYSIRCSSHETLIAPYSLNEILFTLDTGLAWVKELEQGNLVTGNPGIDTLINRYGFTPKNISCWPDVDFCLLSFYTDTNYNIAAITKDLDTIPGVRSATPNIYGGDGPDIYIPDSSEISNSIPLIYSYGWGDCWAGCLYRRSWEFRIYFDDCSVEFVRSFGSKLPTSVFNDKERMEEVTVKPNPFTDKIVIDGLKETDYFQLLNINGQLIKYGKLENHTIYSLESLPSGQYILRVFSPNGVINQKVIKL